MHNEGEPSQKLVPRGPNAMSEWLSKLLHNVGTDRIFVLSQPKVAQGFVS